MIIDFWAFLIAITALTMAPGVDTVIVIRNTARGGWKDGMITNLGICSGLFIHATVSAVGIAVILLQTAWAYQLLKWAGAAYLIWLGWNSLRSAWQGQAFLVQTKHTEQQALNIKQSFKEGFLSNVLNPKTVIFYMAFLPQFINPEGSALKQSLLLASIHFVIAMIWQGLLALMVNQAKQWLTRPKVNQWFNFITGSILSLLGIRLLLELES